MQIKLFQVLMVNWNCIQWESQIFASKLHTCLAVTPSIPFKAVTRETIDAIHARATVLTSVIYTVMNVCKFNMTQFIRKLEKLQERALRIVFNSNLFTNDELLKKSNLSTLHNRRLQDISITMFKYHMGLLRTYLNNVFVTKFLKYHLF